MGFLLAGNGLLVVFLTIMVYKKVSLIMIVFKSNESIETVFVNDAYDLTYTVCHPGSGLGVCAIGLAPVCCTHTSDFGLATAASSLISSVFALWQFIALQASAPENVHTKAMTDGGHSLFTGLWS